MSVVSDPCIQTEDHKAKRTVLVELRQVTGNGVVARTDILRFPWTTSLAAIRNEISRLTGIRQSAITLYYNGKVHLGVFRLFELRSPSEPIRLVYHTSATTDGSFIQIASSLNMNDDFVFALNEARAGLSQGIKPELSLYGTGGTYFVLDPLHIRQLIFKPMDEEPFAENNPRGFADRTGGVGFKKGIKSGTGWEREVAAYAIDHTGFFNVPPTAHAIMDHPSLHYNSSPSATRTPTHKYGSLQLYLEDCSLSSDWSYSMYDVRDVQKIAFLDMYLLNTDRNDANILVRPRFGRYKLFPIDHGYALPDRLEINEYSWCWLNWKQVKMEWTQEIVEYASNLDIDADIALLRESLGIGPICLFYMRISGILLKYGISHGLTPYDLAQMYIRSGIGDEGPSVIEQVVERCVCMMPSLVAAPTLSYSMTRSPSHASLHSPSTWQTLPAAAFNPLLPLKRLSPSRMSCEMHTLTLQTASHQSISLSHVLTQSVSPASMLLSDSSSESECVKESVSESVSVECKQSVLESALICENVNEKENCSSSSSGGSGSSSSSGIDFNESVRKIVSDRCEGKYSGLKRAVSILEFDKCSDEPYCIPPSICERLEDPATFSAFVKSIERSLIFLVETRQRRKSFDCQNESTTDSDDYSEDY